MISKQIKFSKFQASIYILSISLILQIKLIINEIFYNIEISTYDTSPDDDDDGTFSVSVL